jgi:hypothetical protein
LLSFLCCWSRFAYRQLCGCDGDGAQLYADSSPFVCISICASDYQSHCHMPYQNIPLDGFPTPFCLF